MLERVKLALPLDSRAPRIRKLSSLTLSTEELANILLYHAVDGEVDAATVERSKVATLRSQSTMPV